MRKCLKESVGRKVWKLDLLRGAGQGISGHGGSRRRTWVVPGEAGSGLVDNGCGEKKEKEGNNNGGREDQTNQRLAVGGHMVLSAQLVDRTGRQQRCFRHVLSERTVVRG